MKKLSHFLSALLVLFLLCPLVTHAESPLSNFSLTKSSFITAKEAAQLVWDIIEDEFSDLFVPVSIDYNEMRLVAYVETEGLADKLKIAYAEGHDQNYPPWAEYKAAFLTAHNAIADELDAHGRSDIYFEMWLYNDDTRVGKRSPFIKYLAYTTSRDSVMDEALFRYEDPEQDVSELPEDIQPIHTYLKSTLEKIGFEYILLTYNESRNLFYVEVAINDVGENLYHAKQAGYGETYLPWEELKDFLQETYNEILTHLDEIGRNDISIIFELENDEVHIKGYNDRVSFDPLWTINNSVVKEGIVVWDVMK